MTERAWLADLLVNWKLPTTLKKHVGERLIDLENTPQLGNIPQRPITLPQMTIVNGAPQAPSTIAALSREPGQPHQPVVAMTPGPPVIPPPPTSPMAAVALQQREAVIARTLGSDKPEPGRTSPRKF